MNAAPATHDVRKHILDIAYPLMLRKGFTGVGLAEVLSAARVPKGSFYHYFGSKEAFGEAVLEAYFSDYLRHVDALMAQPGSGAQRLIAYFDDWREAQTGSDPDGRCLVVKLGAEVCDLSEPMRAALDRGTGAVIARLAQCIERGRDDGSLAAAPDPQTAAQTLYQSWIGASLLAKVQRSSASMDRAMSTTRLLLGLPAQD
ncbi:TetR/AcrR family transcriptional regulator [Lysobacter enzymogenes]|jgi:TetR/AcrR family transcriptional repressor of nem operon|uniref:TetR/AcrR family transcriptional regulator, transcriptional repressor for nem operon n=1 Tax=Lysobacter enzymogenes TaxID=69 RepID=A0AAU9ALU2_LYSEN|nr:TetR/AcrR family transcriptional regulator [Lysobacter enzymogenes]BAV99359.1 TetR/AcrR family transcriptional regulator, transcriptional repressor for nem operon [Lysobacter enzymogenes]SDW68853.1 TetR/AcrR family transcriptional regulator, transcriptional repressor for nem operon [Lysobacter enzymogenes]